MPTNPDADLRLATPADVEPVRDLVRSAYAKWVPLIGREPLPMTADYAHAVQAHRIDLLYADGALAALIETAVRPDCLWIENIAVEPDRQGQGLGRRLLAHAERLAAEAGRGELRLLTNAAFAANIALYERLGYAVRLREPHPGGVAVHMRKPLGAPSPLPADGGNTT
jgi:GNAT superfamily N-acetyltransferase